MGHETKGVGEDGMKEQPTWSCEGGVTPSWPTFYTRGSSPYWLADSTLSHINDLFPVTLWHTFGCIISGCITSSRLAGMSTLCVRESKVPQRAHQTSPSCEHVPHQLGALGSNQTCMVGAVDDLQWTHQDLCKF